MDEQVKKKRKPRKKSPVEELCLWFWSEILERKDGAYTSPEWWRHMANAKKLLEPPPKGRGYDAGIIKRAVEKVLQSSIVPESLFVIELSLIRGEKTFYELAQDIWSDAPPIYNDYEVKLWKERNEQYLTREPSRGS
jgi:hypothetical protein